MITDENAEPRKNNHSVPPARQAETNSARKGLFETMIECLRHGKGNIGPRQDRRGKKDHAKQYPKLKIHAAQSLQSVEAQMLSH